MNIFTRLEEEMKKRWADPCTDEACGSCGYVGNSSICDCECHPNNRRTNGEKKA